MTTRALLVDMDGTLIDSTAAVEDAWRGFCERHDVDLAELLTFAHGRPTRATVGRYLDDPALVERESLILEDTEVGGTDGIVEVPGAAALTASLGTTGWAVVTSAGRQLATTRIAAAGITLPEVIVTSEDVEHGKPDPEPYRRGAELLGVEPTECVVLEDSHAGVESGLAAGCKVVVVGAMTDFDARLPRVEDLRGQTLESLLALAGVVA